VLDELVLHGPVGAQLAGGGVAAVEAHEGVGELVVEFSFDVLLIDRGGDRVVDVQQGDGVTGDTHPDVLAEGAVDVHLAGDGDAPAHQAGVDVAGLKAEGLGEGGPALVGEGHILPGNKGSGKLKKDVTVMRALQSKAASLPGLTQDKELAHILEKFAEDIRFSDPVSSESLGDIEADLTACVDELQRAIVDGDCEAALTLEKKARAVLNERNRLCKLKK